MINVSRLWYSIKIFYQWHRHNPGIFRPRSNEALSPKLADYVETKLIITLQCINTHQQVLNTILERKFAIESNLLITEDNRATIARLDRALSKQQDKVNAEEFKFTMLWNLYAEMELLKPSWENDRYIFRQRYADTPPRKNRNVLTSAFD